MKRNLEYARELTRKALEVGMAPVTPHLYMTQCLNEEDPWEREIGMRAGLELLKSCDLLLMGMRYGISKGMMKEIAAAKEAGMDVVNADKLHYKLKNEKVQEMEEKWFVNYAREHTCDFCKGKVFHTCTSFSCDEPFQKAYEYAKNHRDRILQYQ